MSAFLDFMKPRTAGVAIIILNLHYINVDIIRAVTNFLEGKTVSSVQTDEIKLDKTD